MLFRTQLYRSVLSLTLLASAGLLQAIPAHAASKNSALPILETYVNIALDSYSKAEADAKELQQHLDAFAASPSAASLEAAKKAWLASRESYGQTEIFRLANGPIDAEDGWVAEAYGAPEGQINAWPLDENMIDYTIDAEGHRTSNNIVDTAGLFNPGGEDAQPVDATTITSEVLAALNENGGDANVASGYHAIEFLLWGQDQDYADFRADTITHGALVAGQRPLEDFTTEPHAKRRLAYLTASAEKLVRDLSAVTQAWHIEVSNDCDEDARGCYRAALLGQLTGKDANKNIASDAALKQIIAGMGVFIKSELANERIAVAVLTPSEEDEHSCFSDNTHRDIATNYLGFVNVLKAQYSDKNYGPSLYAKASANTRKEIDRLIAAIDKKVSNMNHLAQTQWHFDYQILQGNNATEIRAMKNDMRKLGNTMVLVAKDMALSLTTDDVTDAEETQI